MIKLPVRMAIASIATKSYFQEGQKESEYCNNSSLLNIVRPPPERTIYRKISFSQTFRNGVRFLVKNILFIDHN